MRLRPERAPGKNREIVVDDPAADLARARKLLNDLAHPSPALAQMVKLAQRDPKSGGGTAV